MSKTIFVDMDGVLVDWVGGVLNLHARHIPPSEVQWDVGAQLGIPAHEFWQPQGRAFWSNLGWTEEGPGLLWFVSSMRGATYALLSSPCLTEGCADGKRDWVRYHLPDKEGDLFLGRNKHRLAGPGKVLIDDHDKNVEAWRAAGGPAVLVPRTWNSRISETDAEGRFDLGKVTADLRRAVDEGG